MNKKQLVFTDNIGEGYTRADRWNKGGNPNPFGPNGQGQTESDEPTRTR